MARKPRSEYTRKYYQLNAENENILPSGNLQLSPLRVTTVTRRGDRAVVFAETERKFFGCYYSGDIYGWVATEWFKPRGTYTKTGNASPLDLNLTQYGIEREAKQRESQGS